MPLLLVAMPGAPSLTASIFHVARCHTSALLMKHQRLKSRHQPEPQTHLHIKRRLTQKIQQAGVKKVEVEVEEVGVGVEVVGGVGVQ